MKIRTILIALGLLLAGAGLVAHVRAVRRCAAPDLVAGYRGVVMEFPKAQLAWVKKGSSIDVISVFETVMKNDRKEKVSATILQNVKVAGVDYRKGTAVLLLNPLEAEYAVLAPIQGSVGIALRAAGDTKLAQIEMASYTRLVK